MLYWAWGQRGKGDHSRLPATEVGMSLAGIGSLEQEERGGSFFSLLVALEGARVALGLAGVLPGLVSGAKQHVWEGRLEGEDL